MIQRITGLVPVRGFTTGKTRLAEELSSAERAMIMRWMMAGVATAALESGAVTELAVISPDPGVLAFARALDERIVPIFQDSDRPGLNPAVTIGRDWAAEAGAAGLLVLFADLPFLTAHDIRTIVASSAQVVIATDRYGLGTNASLVRLAGKGRDFVYQYGANSAGLHAAEADRLGLTVATIQTPGTAFDLDTPQDWRELSRTHPTGQLSQLQPSDLPHHAVKETIGAGEHG